jgi:hypothetical protein
MKKRRVREKEEKKWTGQKKYLFTDVDDEVFVPDAVVDHIGLAASQRWPALGQRVLGEFLTRSKPICGSAQRAFTPQNVCEAR